jgi:hypothetical protein
LEENAAYLMVEFVKHDLHREGQAGDRGGRRGGDKVEQHGGQVGGESIEEGGGFHWG